jgi:hypothetical protein
MGRASPLASEIVFAALRNETTISEIDLLASDKANIRLAISALAFEQTRDAKKEETNRAARLPRPRTHLGPVLAASCAD